MKWLTGTSITLWAWRILLGIYQLRPWPGQSGRLIKCWCIIYLSISSLPPTSEGWRNVMFSLCPPRGGGRGEGTPIRLDGGPPAPSPLGWMGYPPPPLSQEAEQHREYLVRGGWYASCVHAGGIYFLVFDLLPLIDKLWYQLSMWHLCPMRYPILAGLRSIDNKSFNENTNSHGMKFWISGSLLDENLHVLPERSL